MKRRIIIPLYDHATVAEIQEMLDEIERCIAPAVNPYVEQVNVTTPNSDSIDVNLEIRNHWNKVCGEFPEANTPLVAKKVAEDFGITVTRVFEAF